MGKLLSALLILLVGLVALTRIPAAETAQMHRDILWAATKLCVASRQTTGASFPCISVDLGAPGRPGVALMHVPGEKTHIILMPTDEIAGLESPQLQTNDGALIIRAAIEARQHVVAATGGRADLRDIAIAINSRDARSQDHLHIHVDCVDERAKADVLRSKISRNFDWLPMSLKGRRYLAMQMNEDDVGRLNPFAELARFLPRPDLITQSSLAVIAGDKGFIVLADVRPAAHAEFLLDHACAASRK